MTYREVAKLAGDFRRTEGITAKQDIIRRVVAEDGEDGLELLAKLVGKPKKYLAWYGGLEKWRRDRSRRRRGKKPISVTDREAAEIAAVASYNGEIKFGKRNTSSFSRLNGKGRPGRKLVLYDCDDQGDDA